MKKLTLLIFLSFLGLYGLHFATSKRSHCFSPSFCLTDNPLFHSAALVKAPSAEVQKILAQEFYFLSSGNQSYAFVSQDGRYVLKLVKFHTTTEPKKLQRIFDGFQLAEKIHPEHQGLVYLHFPSESQFDHPLRLRDRAGRWHSMDLDSLFFALQKKATPLNEHLQSLTRTEAEQELGRLLAMIKSDLEAGLYDQDHNIFHNTGFAEGAPMRIDFGKLSHDPNIAADPEICKLRSERINPWLDSHFKKIPIRP